MKIPPAAKVGLLTIVAIALLLFSLMWLKGKTFSSGERVSVNFKDVDGMRPGSIVQMMGIRVGLVEEVNPIITDKEAFVEVKFIILKDNIKIPQGSVVSVQQSGLIGEKFVEITPPEVHYINVLVKDYDLSLPEYSPIKILNKDKMEDVGEIRSFKVISRLVDEYKNTKKEVIYYQTVKDFFKIGCIITRAGFKIPEGSEFKIIPEHNCLLILPPAKYIVNLPPKDKVFTIVEPLRIKTFMEQQVKSAEALQLTSQKVNEILAPEQIQDMKSTIKNTKILTARLTSVVDEANRLMVRSKKDLEKLVDSSTELSQNMIVISNNINSIIGDPQLRTDVIDTVHSIKKSTKELSTIISDPDLKETITTTKQTSKNLSEVVEYIKDLTTSNDVKEKMNSTISNLNDSLSSLTSLLDKTEEITADQQCNIEQIMDNTRSSSKNLDKFSKKLNKHFLLFRLLF